jgi:hypothetical protein
MQYRADEKIRFFSSLLGDLLPHVEGFVDATERSLSTSCPHLLRASTPFFVAKKDVDGRDKPGHDAR